MVKIVNTNEELKQAMESNEKTIIISNEKLSKKVSKFVTLNQFLKGLAWPSSGKKLPNNFPEYIKMSSGLEITKEDILATINGRYMDPDLIYFLKENYYIVIESISPWKLKLNSKR